jgi:hypothetical protein
MKIFKYKSYAEYKEVQTKANKRKLDWVWVDVNTLHEIAEYVINYNPDVAFGLCHGTRRGEEQKRLMEDFLSLGKKVKVLGTEISNTATQFEHTIEWDFHEVKKEWIDNVDFIYSNSFDHTYDPEKCLDAWMSCLNEKGLCIIDWSRQDEACSGVEHPSVDPFIASLEEYKNIIEKKYKIVDIVESHSINLGQDYGSVFIFIKKK